MSTIREPGDFAPLKPPTGGKGSACHPGAQSRDLIAENKALNDREKFVGDIELESTPIRVSMNMTGKCNIRCIYCHLTFADYFSKDELDLETFRRLDPFLERLSHLVYFSSTEPLMAQYFDEVFKYSCNFGCEKYASTDGILLDEARAELIVDGEMEFLTVSFGGMTRESFTKAHQVDQLESVTKNIETLNRVKERQGVDRPRVRIVFVTWKDNAHELPLAVQFAHDHDCSEGVKITFLKAYDDNLIEQIPYDHQDYINNYVWEAQLLGKELGVPVTFDGGNFDDSSDETVNGHHRKCFEPWERFQVEADGSVRTCPAVVNSITAGNLKLQSATEIWNGPVYQDFRRRVNTENPPDPCKNCTHNFHKDFSRREIWDQRELDLGIYQRLGDRNYLKRGSPGAKRD